MNRRESEGRLAILCLGAGVVLLFTGLGFLAVDQRFDQPVSWSLIASLALLICYAVLAPTSALELLRDRRARYGSLSVLVSAVVIGIVVMVNVLASHATASIDLTRSGQYTLSAKTRAVLRGLTRDVTITGFYRGDLSSSRQQEQLLLNQYQAGSPHVKVRYLDPDVNADQALRLGVRIDGSLALEYEGRKPVVLTLGSQTEQDLTGAILRLEAGRTPNICWASGDGERDLQDSSSSGYTEAAGELKTDNYSVTPLLLSQLAAIPTTCDIVAIVGPQKAVSAGGVAAVQKYLDAGGKLLLAADPWVDDPGVLPSLNTMLSKLGASFTGGLVVDPDPAHTASNDQTTPVAFQYGDSPVTRNLANRVTFYPQPTAITVAQGSPADATPLVQTTIQSYEAASPRDNVSRKAGDRGGPFTIAETLEAASGSSRSRVLLFGTSSFAENRTLPGTTAAPGDNLLLLTGSFDWLSEQDALIQLPAKPPAARPVFLTDQELNFAGLLTSYLAPALVLAIGLLVWISRRRTGLHASE